MHKANRGLTTGAIVVALTLFLGTVALAVYDGRTHSTATVDTRSGVAAFQPASRPANVAAPTQGAPAVADSSYLTTSSYPAANPPFKPDYPPFGQPGGGNGLGAWGVAYKETSDSSAKPDAALIKSAFQDASRHAQELATAAGVKLGAILALDDVAVNQPYYGDCVKAQELPTNPPTGSGSSGSATGAPDKVAPAPGPACQEKHYLVAWVMVRYAIA